ncbi:MAG: DUF2070 family protein [Nitrososphaerales archaeon]
MTAPEKDSSNNLSRRYRHLFRLPSTSESILFASIPAILLEVIVQSVLKVTLTRVLAFAILTELILLLTIEIDRQLLKRRSGVGTYRRIAAIAIISNMLWLLIGLVALLVFLLSRNDGRFIALVIVGLFFAVCFRAFIFGSIFYGNTIQGLPLSFVQPVLLGIGIVYVWNTSKINEFEIITAVLAGMVYLIAIEAYLRSVNNSAPIGGMKPLQLLQAFLSAWTLEDAAKIEDVLGKVSKTTDVGTSMIRIEGSSNGENALIIVPGIHPGPFYPIGSSNLPGDIYSKLRTAQTVPLTVHSISDHELNLPSKSEVESYVVSLENPKQIDEGKAMTLPVVKKQGKATATGIAFGSTCLVALTQAPYGMEDFPIRVKNEIDRISNEKGFKLALVIDTHNSEGAKPNEKECGDAINAAREAIDELTKSKQQNFKLGFAHSSELNVSIPKDVGPAGMGLLYFEVGESCKYCFVIVDANNSKLGFREEVFKDFEKIAGVGILELCTSDTHVTAAKTSGAKGYLALGDLVSVDAFVAVLNSLHDIAKSRVGAGSFDASSVTTHVKTIGSEILQDFSGLIDNTSSAAKRGAEILGILGAAIVVLIAIA